MRRRRILSVLLIVVMIFTLTACEKGGKEGSSNVIRVTFDTDGGSAVSALEIKKGSTIVKPESPKKDGFVFDKWLLNGTEFDFSAAVSEDVTLKACWVSDGRAEEEARKKAEEEAKRKAEEEAAKKAEEEAKKKAEEEAAKKAAYDDTKTGIYDALVSNDIEETDDGLVAKVYKVKPIKFDDSFIDDMRPGDVVKLSQYKNPWTGKRYADVSVNHIEANTRDGKQVIAIHGSLEDSGEVYYFREESAGDWRIYHEYEGDSPESGEMRYISSEMRLLFADSSKVVKQAYFDQRGEEKISDIRKLFTSNGKVNRLRCSLRAYHGVVDWCDVEWGLNF